MVHSHRHHGHDHGPRGEPAGRAATTVRSSRRLAVVFGLTCAYMLAEVVGGLAANSLALIADAGHMLTDAMALGLAWAAAWWARRPPDPSRTYGYQRAEILAALLNGVTLIVIALFVLLEAWARIRQPPPVDYTLMGFVAVGGLVVNLVAAILLHGQPGLNVRAAYLHVLGDLLGSAATVIAAALIAWFGWFWADPVVSAAIGVIIVFSAVRLVLDSVSVLMESAPAHLDTRQVRECLVGLAGVCDVHDLHLWSLGGDSPLLSAHLVLDHSRPAAQVLRQATEELRLRFAITHATLQVEPPDFNIVQSLTGP